jgi:DNA-binding cell septation regulator SpoVG
MSVVIVITETFPCNNVLATGNVIIDDQLIIDNVRLCLNRSNKQYYIQYPASKKKDLCNVIDKEIRIKIRDGFIYQYEKLITSGDRYPKEFLNTEQGIYYLEKVRIQKSSFGDIQSCKLYL